jgi:hypothetical protein
MLYARLIDWAWIIATLACIAALRFAEPRQKLGAVALCGGGLFVGCMALDFAAGGRAPLLVLGAFSGILLLALGAIGYAVQRWRH